MIFDEPIPTMAEVEPPLDKEEWYAVCLDVRPNMDRKEFEELWKEFEAYKVWRKASMTLGEYRVGVSFNPSGNEKVNEIKRAAADLIDLVQSISYEPGVGLENEVSRLKELAMTHVEAAAMWAVKAATKKPPPRK